VLNPPGPEHLVWIDGELVPWANATTSIVSHHYGVGVFEGLRAYEGRIFRLEEHTDRLFRSARIMNIEIPTTNEILNAAQRELLERNQLRSAYLRPFVFYDGLMGLSLRVDGLRVRVAIVAVGWNDTAKMNSVNLKTSTITRHPTRAKANGCYVNAILALQEARAGGADDALLLGPDGFVAEASGANVFLVRDGVVATPPSTAALEGITRKTVLEFAKAAGIPAVERTITVDELYIADEVFLTGTAAEIASVSSIDGRKLPEARPFTQRFFEMYQNAVRGRP